MKHGKYIIIALLALLCLLSGCAQKANKKNQTASVTLHGNTPDEQHLIRLLDQAKSVTINEQDRYYIGRITAKLEIIDMGMSDILHLQQSCKNEQRTIGLRADMDYICKQIERAVDYLNELEAPEKMFELQRLIYLGIEQSSFATGSMRVYMETNDIESCQNATAHVDLWQQYHAAIGSYIAALQGEK